MKFKIIIFLIFLIKITFAGEVENLFKQSNEHYQKGEYQESIRILESIYEEGFHGKSLFYNLGNAYFRVGKIGLAILYYEKAKKISPSDEDIRHNLSFANARISDKIETLPEFFIFDWWENLLAFFSISGLTYLAYAFYLLVLFSAGYYFFASTLKAQRIAFYGGIGATLLLVIIIVLLSVNLNRELNVKYGVIVESVVVTKFSPDQNSKDAFIIHEGLKVRAEDSVNDWMKIKLPDGKVGWLKKNTIRII